MPDGTTAIFTHFAVCLHHHNPRGAAAGNFDIDARHELALRGGYAVICSRDPWSAYLVSNQPPAYSKLMMLMNYGVNRYLRPQPITPEEEKNRLEEREEYIQRHLNQLWNTIPKKEEVQESKSIQFPKDPEENLLYFIEKNAPKLSSNMFKH